MKTRTKSVYILVATLLVGIVIGILVSSAMRTYQEDRLRDLRRREGFATALEKAVVPRDSVQRVEIRAVVEASGERMGELRREHYRALRAEIDSLKAMLEPILDAEQEQRLEAWFSRDRRRDSEHDSRNSRSDRNRDPSRQ